MSTQTALVTGFEPYGPWQTNPSQAVAHALAGEQIGNLHVVAATLPVVLDGLASRVSALLSEHNPSVVLSTGLHPGAATLRMERVGLNVADFNKPDNQGIVAADRPVVDGAPLALAATLPVREIVTAHLAAGIPSVVSNSAGTYLCNATLYQFAASVAERGADCRVGFLHLPFTSAQVAQLMDGSIDAASGGAPGADAIASMSLDDMVAGARLALACAAAGDTSNRS